MIWKPMAKITLWAALLIYASLTGISCASDSEAHESNEVHESEEQGEVEDHDEDESEDHDEDEGAQAETAAPAGEATAYQKPTLGREHRELAKWVGDWNCAQTIMMPGQEPMQVEGKASFRSVFGGRFVQQDFSMSFMGQKFMGRGVSGYNQATKMYESTWTDNWGTAIAVSRGFTHSDGKTMTYHGSSHDEKGQKFMTREYISWRSDDEVLFEMYNNIDGKEMKVMTIIYTRIK